MATAIEIIPANIPITVTQGNTLAWTTTISEGGTPVDLSVVGNVVSVVIEKTTTAENLLEVSSSGVSPQITLNASGEAAVSITAAQTAAIAVGGYNYALKWTKPSGAVRTLHAGPLTISKPYT